MYFVVWRGMMYTIGQVAEMSGLPVSTLRYYDKEGLFPGLERRSGIRRFGERELDTLRLIDCLKRTGMELRDIRQFLTWCDEGASTYPDRRRLLQAQLQKVEEELEQLCKTRDMLRFKCWYYETAIRDGGEERLRQMIPDELPPDIRRLFDNAHS